MRECEYVIGYLRNDIRKYYNAISKLNTIINDTTLFLKALINHDSSYDFNENVFRMFEDNVENFDKLVKGVYILDHVDYDKLKDEYRIQEILNLIHRTKLSIYSFVEKKEAEYKVLRDEYVYKRNAYENYIRLLMGDPIYKEDEIIKNDFFDFLDQLSIEKDIKESVKEHLNNSKKHVIQEEIFVEEKKEKDLKKIDLETLSLDEIVEIKELIKEYEKLSEKEKNDIISAYGMMLSNEEDYENVIYGYTKDEIRYLCLIYSLYNLYEAYNDIYQEKNLKDAQDDEELYLVLQESIKESIESIRKKLEEIKTNLQIEDDLESEEKNDNHNLVIFLDVNEKETNGDIKRVPVLDTDIEKIEEDFGGEKEGLVRQITKMLQHRLISMPNSSLKKLGHLANKPLVNYESNLFNEFNVYSSRGKGHNPARIVYTTLSVSEKNKREIISHYNLPSDANIYLVLGIFIKKNDDSEYVKIVHSRIVKEYENIKKLFMLFEEDFNDISRHIAFKLLDSHIMKCHNLSETYISMENRK